MMNWPTLSGRESWLFLWQMFPIWTSLGCLILSFFIPDSTVSDRFHAPNRDLPVIRYTIGILAVFSSIVWIWTCSTSAKQHGFLSLFLPAMLPAHTTDFVSFTREFFKVDEVSLFSNTFLWLGYLFWDLKHAGMVQASWLRLLFYLSSSVVILGPGATAGMGWLWRENVLASTRHKDAITEASVRRHEPYEHKNEKGLDK
jgi:hypothetical protein